MSAERFEWLLADSEKLVPFIVGEPDQVDAAQLGNFDKFVDATVRLHPSEII